MHVIDRIIKSLDKDIRFETILSWVYQYYVNYSFGIEELHAMKYPSTLETKEEGGSKPIPQPPDLRKINLCGGTYAISILIIISNNNKSRPPASQACDYWNAIIHTGGRSDSSWPRWASHGQPGSQGVCLQNGRHEPPADLIHNCLGNVGE